MVAAGSFSVASFSNLDDEELSEAIFWSILTTCLISIFRISVPVSESDDDDEEDDEEFLFI